MNYFGTPQFAKVGKLFRDLPIEALDRTMTGLNQAYSENLEKFNALDAAMNAVKVSNEDAHIKEKKLKEYREKMKAFAESDGFEKADAFVGSMFADFAGDKDLNHLMANHKLREEDEALARQLRAQGITPIDARAIYNGDNFQSITEDEMGNKIYNDYRGGYMRPGDYEKVRQTMFDQMAQRGGTWNKKNADGSLTESTWRGIRERDIQEYMEHALKRYKGTDTYKTEMIDYQSQGYSKEEAEQMVYDGLLGAGMERVGTQNSSRTLGYQNPNTARGRASRGSGAPDSGIKPSFRLQDNPIKVGGKDSNLPFQFLDNLAMVNPTKQESAVFLGGKSDMPVDSEPKKHAIEGGYFRFNTKNSDEVFGDNGKAINDAEVIEGSLLGYYQAFTMMGPEGEELFTMGKGAPSGMGRDIPMNSTPKFKNGTYYVEDKDGNEIPLKPKNVKRIQTEDGVEYYVPMTESEEFQAMGAEGAVNSQTISLGYGREGGARTLDNFPANSVKQAIAEVTADPTTRDEINSGIFHELRNRALSEGPESGATELYNTISSKLAENPERGHYLMSLLQRELEASTSDIESEKSKGRSAQMVDGKGATAAMLLNSAINRLKYKKTVIQTPKADVSTNYITHGTGILGDVEE